MYVKDFLLIFECNFTICLRSNKDTILLIHSRDYIINSDFATWKLFSVISINKSYDFGLIVDLLIYND